MTDSEPIWIGYDSDLNSENDNAVDDDISNVDGSGQEDEEPPVKRFQRQLNEPVLVTWLKSQEKWINEQRLALCDIEKLVKS